MSSNFRQRILLWCLVGLATFSGCAGAQQLPARTSVWALPSPLISAWPWQRLDAQILQLSPDNVPLSQVSDALVLWMKEQGGSASEAKVYRFGGMPAYAIVQATEARASARPLRHVAILRWTPASPGLVRAIEAEVRRIHTAKRYTQGETVVHLLGEAQPMGELDHLSGGGVFAQLWLAWSMDKSGADFPYDASEMPDASRRWEAFWANYRVSFRGNSGLADYDAVLHFLGELLREEATLRGEASHAALEGSAGAWFEAAGAWLGEQVRPSCPEAQWVEGEKVLSDFPALMSLSGFRARPVSFVRGRISGEELRSSADYLQQTRAGCRDLRFGQ